MGIQIDHYGNDSNLIDDSHVTHGIIPACHALIIADSQLQMMRTTLEN